MSRFIRFYQQSLTKSPKFSVRFLARIFEYDNRTVLGKNSRTIARTCNKTNPRDLNPAEVKRKSVYVTPPDDGMWMAGLASELLSIRDSRLDAVGFSLDEISFMLTSICTS